MLQKCKSNPRSARHAWQKTENAQQRRCACWWAKHVRHRRRTKRMASAVQAERLGRKRSKGSCRARKSGVWPPSKTAAGWEQEMTVLLDDWLLDLQPYRLTWTALRWNSSNAGQIVFQGWYCLMANCIFSVYCAPLRHLPRLYNYTQRATRPVHWTEIMFGIGNLAKHQGSFPTCKIWNGGTFLQVVQVTTDRSCNPRSWRMYLGSWVCRCIRSSAVAKPYVLDSPTEQLAIPQKHADAHLTFQFSVSMQVHYSPVLPVPNVLLKKRFSIAINCEM